MEKQYQEKNIFVVAHSGVNRVLDFLQKGITFDDLAKPENHLTVPKNAEIISYVHESLPRNTEYELDFHKPYIDEFELEIDGEKLVRTPEVMDVWFDSGSMPIAQNHKLGESVNFDPIPADYISEGVDQTRGWFYTMHAIANLLHDTPTQNYKNVICLGLVLDAEGQKMSKSRGNVVSPWEMFEKYGADVVRFWFYSVNQSGEFKNFDEKSLDEVSKKVFNPLRNVVSFYEMYAPSSEELPWVNPFDSTNVLDQWVLGMLQELCKVLVESLDDYKVLESARAIREFINELSTWYVRRSRDRFKSDNETDKTFALVTLQYVLEQLSRYMAPFTPFISEEIYLKVRMPKYEESVHLTSWHTWDFTSEPKFGHTMKPMQAVRELVTLGLEARQKSGNKVRQPLASITIAEDLPESFQEILKDELNVKQVIIDTSLGKNEVRLDTEITDDLKNEGEMRDLIRKIQDMRKTADLVPKDIVTVFVTDIKPDWFETSEVLRNELLTTVGAKEIVWRSSEEKLEVI